MEEDLIAKLQECENNLTIAHIYDSDDLSEINAQRIEILRKLLSTDEVNFNSDVTLACGSVPIDTPDGVFMDDDEYIVGTASWWRLLIFEFTTEIIDIRGDNHEFMIIIEFTGTRVEDQGLTLTIRTGKWMRNQNKEEV